MLSIYTGLRRSDVLNLKWESLEYVKGRYFLSVKISKTKQKMTIPLSKEAVKLLGRVKKRGPVFPELTEYVINKYLPKLISDAGITKHITFHCFRHTFAMRLLDKGVDIYTIAKLLGHTMVTSTQYYAVVSNERARQIIEMLEKEE